MDAYIFDAVRTPRGAGKKTGALHGVKPIELLATLYRALEERNDFDTAEVEDVVIGCNTQTGEQGTDIAKISAVFAGWSDSISGGTISRFCSSGLDAVNSAAAKISCGMQDLVVAGGVESMSRVPMFSDNGAWFADPEVAVATRFVHMGIAADLVATLGKITREEADAYALASHRRAAAARDGGAFARSIVPVASGDGMVERDEWIRDGLTAEKLAALPPAFADVGADGHDAVALERYPELERVEHVHTVGSAPGIVDAASLLLVGSRAKGEALGLKPRARVVSMGDASVEPVLMLTAPAPATRKALDKAGMTVGDVDLFEINESFAAVPLEYMRALDLDPATVNVNGGAIAMGHPLGATGGILLGTLLDELERRDFETGVVAIPAGAGIGTATILQRV